MSVHEAATQTDGKVQRQRDEESKGTMTLGPSGDGGDKGEWGGGELEEERAIWFPLFSNLICVTVTDSPS